MSREGITVQLAAKSVEVHELVYSEVSVSVYKGEHRGTPAAVKVLTLGSTSDSHVLEQECSLMSIVSHPHLIRLLDCFWLQAAQGYCYIIVTEWCSRDLAKDMEQRRKQQNLWSEADLFTALQDLVSALAYLQGMGIAHRDIKPENIFITAQGDVKIGDFGSAKWTNELMDLATLRGTPLFLSPKLRAAFVSGQTEVQHNMFKSDVFSLGLTLLTIARLNFPMDLASVSATDETVEECLSVLRYSDSFKTVLRKMLWMDESRRWSFLDIEKCLTPALGVRPQLSMQVTPMMSEVQSATLPEEDKRPFSEVFQRAASAQDTHDGVENRKLPQVIKCLKCTKLIDKWAYDAPCKVVQLYCDPQQHWFCSPGCFLDFAETSIHPLSCPSCQTEIDTDTLLFYRKLSSARSSTVRRSVGDICSVSANSQRTANTGGSKGLFACWVSVFRGCV